MKLSVVIPSYRDPLLKPTIQSLLDQSSLGTDLEVLAVLDGYWPDPTSILQDPRVKYLHLGHNRGMRGAINAGILASRGEYIMRTDEHATFGPNYDVILTTQCEPNWIVTPRRYTLDVAKWELMDISPVDHMKLKVVRASGIRKFSGVEAPGDDSQPIQESMAMQGSCWLMPRAWWDKVIGELQTDGYGPHYQDSHEMVFKTWQAGGRLMVNKNTWHSHKHRSFPRTHNNGTKENPANSEGGWTYALEVWEPYYREVTLPRWKAKKS